MVEIITLVENLVYPRGLIAEHGLSVYFEAGGKKFLMDTGQSDCYARNASQLGIDLSTIDVHIISHGHFDHTGGLGHFLEINKTAGVIMKKEALTPKFKGGRYMGIPKGLILPEDRITYIQTITECAPGVYIMPTISCYYPIDNHKEGHVKEKFTQKVPDTFDDELFVCVVDNGKLIIISSCSHNGITNIIETATRHFQMPVYQVIGGFHIRISKEDAVNHIIRYFNDKKVENIGICHCTGVEQYVRFKSEVHSNIFYNYTGNRLLIN